MKPFLMAALIAVIASGVRMPSIPACMDAIHHTGKTSYKEQFNFEAD